MRWESQYPRCTSGDTIHQIGHRVGIEAFTMGQLDGKVAFITGIARGQGRSHALTLAREGADIIGLDLCKKPASTPYPGASAEDLDQTIALVEETGRKIVAEQADVRDLGQVQAVFDRGISHFGRV